MSLVKQFRIIVTEKGEEKANAVYRSMIANAPVYTGEVKRSIRIERIHRWKWFIAPHTDHDWYAEHGNHANRSDGFIHPVRAKALAFTDKYGNHHVTSKVRPHKGSRFIERTYHQNK